MKIIYSELKKLLPDLDRPVKKLAEDLTLIGHFVDGLEERGEGDAVISLEIRQNRADCLGYWGLAKDLAVLYDLPLRKPKINLPNIASPKTLPIKVEAQGQIIRIMAVKIGRLFNRPSPEWLKTFLSLHDINSINALVDLTNYIMLWWGIPNHAFDAQKSTDNLIWETNQGKFTRFTSFDGTKVALKKNTLQISNGKEVLSLAGIVGGQNSGVDLNTKEAIIEMALYNPTRVRRDSKNLKVVTEASIRLEKQLDPELIPTAFNHLVGLILENCQGKITSSIFSYYPKEENPALPTINFNPNSPSLIAGVSIDEQFCLKTLKNLGCLVNQKEENNWLVVPPSGRPDLEQEEDLAEEVIRFWGYQNIPTDQPISTEILPDITPDTLHLIEAARNILVNLGYDEVRSWPLIKKGQFLKACFLPEETEAVYTQNNINNHYPLLRASICSSLKIQNQQYQKLKIPQRRFFEIGKIFYQSKEQYRECWSLGIFDQSTKKLTKKMGQFYHDLGIKLPEKIPVSKISNGAMTEIDLTKLSKALNQIPKITITKSPQRVDQAAKELTNQIINLDANLIFTQRRDPQELIEEYQAKFDPNILWQLVILDFYQEGKIYKYTLRAFYYNCSAKEAKKTHKEVFG
ncbi:MAG: phenylalanine--tRNA ligase beta subunit-related protein, partial [Candidatus Shapirobacteria bacterium]|nr:phenylalanine--tRNA ligase beta subunit-related protein [Candidatus Shapirobacteria bacterium]